MADTAALIEVYRRAQQRIIEAILSSKSVAFNAAMLRTINAELARLQGRTVRWVESQIPEAYREGMRSVNKAYEKAYKAAGEVGPKNYPTEFSKINRRAIQVLVDNTKADFDNALGFVGRQIKDDLRQANLQAIADKLASGTTIEKTRKILAEKYASQGLAAIKYKRAGREVYMSLDAYAGLVARSTTAEATNTACRNQVEEFGDDLVQMTKHANACPLCISLEGRVYSVSGKHPDYPALDVAYSDGYANIHPNCGHRLVPYIVDLKTPEQIEEDKRISGRSFDIDQWSPAERAQAESNLRAYKAGQAQKRAIYTDRQQWERYKAELGAENVPKTLSGFRRMKGAGGDNWKELRGQYRSSVVAKRPPVQTSRDQLMSVVQGRLVGLGADKDAVFELLQISKKLSPDEFEVFKAGFEKTDYVMDGGGIRHLLNTNKVNIAPDTPASVLIHETAHNLDSLKYYGFKVEESDYSIIASARIRRNASRGLSDYSAAWAKDNEHLATKLGLQEGESGLDKFNTYWKRIMGEADSRELAAFYGKPTGPDFQKYYEHYRTPKQNKFKTRPRYKNAEADWQAAMREYAERLDVWEAHPEYLERERLISLKYQEYQQRAQACTSLSDIVDAASEGRIEGVVLTGGHPKHYWMQPYSDSPYTMKEMWADYYTLRMEKNTFAIDQLSELLPIHSKALADTYDEFIAGFAARLRGEVIP